MLDATPPVTTTITLTSNLLLGVYVLARWLYFWSGKLEVVPGGGRIRDVHPSGDDAVRERVGEAERDWNVRGKLES